MALPITTVQRIERLVGGDPIVEGLILKLLGGQEKKCVCCRPADVCIRMRKRISEWPNCFEAKHTEGPDCINPTDLRRGINTLYEDWDCNVWLCLQMTQSLDGDFRQLLTGARSICSKEGDSLGEVCPEKKVGSVALQAALHHRHRRQKFARVV